ESSPRRPAHPPGGAFLRGALEPAGIVRKPHGPANCRPAWACPRTGPCHLPHLPNAARTHHFALHIVIELDPSFFHLRSKCSAKLLFQAPYQRVAKRSEMHWLRPELCVLAT